MPTANDLNWMQAALALAAKAESLGEVPVGAVVVKDNQIVGEGWNHPISGNDPTAHAEIMALRNAAQRLENYRLTGCTLYVTIEPCTMCAGAMIHSRIARLVYGASEPKAGVVASNGQLLDGEHFNHRLDYEGGVMGEACSEIISGFFQRRREQLKAEKERKRHSSCFKLLEI